MNLVKGIPFRPNFAANFKVSIQYKMEGWDKHERVVEENGVW